jgi:hypothetical protein
MHFGIMIGYSRKENQIIISKEEMMMEHFMVQQKIDNTQDIYVVPSSQDRQWAEEFYRQLVKAAFVQLYGGYNPKYVTAARNTSLFGEPKGIATGHIGEEMKISLMELIAKCKPGWFPEMKALPKTAECHCCHSNLPEPDGFGGVIVKDKEGKDILVCFLCYTSKEYTK